MFKVRTSKPEKGNKNFIRKASGGWNTCIKGNPTDKNCDALANCVGYASGRFNEIINQVKGTTGCTYKTLNCNAEDFIERAKSAGLKTGKTPKVGAIISWSKGKKHNTGDGAGHVEVVEKVINSNTIYTSSSGYGGPVFWNSTRKNDNGRWGTGSSYKFEGFIYLPDDVQKKIDGDTPEPTPSKHKYKVGDSVILNGPIYKTSNDTKPVKTVKNVKTKITRVVDAKHPYNTTGDLGWMDESSIKYADEPSKELKVGDKVEIIGKGYSNAYGKNGTVAGGIGWTRTVLKIWKGEPYPYQVGEGKSTTGFYKESSLKKK